jgi:hypothetical protein
MEGSGHGLNLLSGHLTGGTEKNHENFSKDSRSLGGNLNSEPPEYETGLLTTRPQSSI